MSIIEQYTDEEFKSIVKNSYSVKEVAVKLGYSSTAGYSQQMIKSKIIKLGLDISHFYRYNKIVRTPNNIFIENSTASQKVLREYYKKGNYTPYECSVCGQKPIWQGKELTLILDHINGKNHDDRLENLHWVCPNCNQQLETTGSKNRQNRKTNKKYYCIDCGIEISKQSTRCKKCASRLNHLSKRIFEITREELKTLIRELPFTSIAKQFNVSDNAIRKRCRSFNLPYKSSEIKEYSDEEWEKI